MVIEGRSFIGTTTKVEAMAGLGWEWGALLDVGTRNIMRMRIRMFG